MVHKITEPQDLAVGSGMHNFIRGNANSLGPILSGVVVDFLRKPGINQNLEYDPFADPYWAPVLVGAVFLVIPAGFTMLILKKWH